MLTQEDKDWFEQRLKIERAETAKMLLEAQQSLHQDLEGVETRLLRRFINGRLRLIRELQSAVESLTERMDKIDPPLIGG